MHDFFKSLASTAKMVGEMIDDVFVDDKKMAPPKAEDIIEELTLNTTDDRTSVILRSLVVYRSIVRHAQKGGTVQFVGGGGATKTLKVRLR